jgi:hypothetical protein
MPKRSGGATSKKTAPSAGEVQADVFGGDPPIESMEEARDDDSDAATSDTGLGDPLAVDNLIDRVHRSFAKSRRDQVPLKLIRAVVESVNLTPRLRQETAPRLCLHRLRFTGEKRLRDVAPEPIKYDQSFKGGVNVVLIPGNLVGKSSILKTIKFALTGDDSDYDADVRSWVEAVWLQFTLSDSPFTIHVARDGDGLVGYVGAGHTLARDGMVEAPAVVLQGWRSQDEMRERLHRFFLDALGLSELSWTQQTDAGAERRTTTWRTYFQALVIPDSSEDYLLLDDEHAMGNQDGLLLSSFLGLRLVEPLNELLVEGGKTRAENRLTNEQREEALAEIKSLEAHRAQISADLALIGKAQAERRAQAIDAPDARRLQELNRYLGETLAELIPVRLRRDELSTEVRRLRAQARSQREAVALELHFTGLEVSLCPNCDAGVADVAIERERAEHRCRLCGNAAHAATSEDVALMNERAVALDEQAEQTTRLRESFAAQVRELEVRQTQLAAEIASAERLLDRGPEYALPTVQEDERKRELLESLGEVRVKLAMATARVMRTSEGTDEAGLRLEIQRKLRDILRKEAECMNAEVLEHLGRLTTDMTAMIGAHSITDITCSPFGKLAMSKNGERLRSFGNIKNPGERLRVKLSFFLAMMRLGRIAGAGRHPGFLMIDQPGSDEMVEEDFAALARVLREVDRDLVHELQILCFTARTQFSEATVANRVYGPKVAGRYAF